MRSKKTSDSVANRLKEFLALIRSYPAEASIPIAGFHSIVEAESEAGSGEDKKATERKVRYALKLAEAQLGAGRSILWEDRHIKVTSLKATTFDRRCQRGEFEKNIVANVLLHWLFGKDDFPLEKQPGQSGFYVACNNKTLDRLKRKLENLRRTSVLTMLIDAGSTTYRIAERFLDAKTMPITVRVREREPDAGLSKELSPRLIIPTIITNSIPIAAKVAASKHHNVITLKLIGGTELVDRRSICGEGALLWLRACQASGVVASADLAIIGTTGYMASYVGSLPALGCHDPSEANLKAEMLKLAANGLRICVMDSRKLIGAEFNCCFAPIAYSAMDLIVIDGGQKKNGSKRAVGNLCKAAADEGVAVLVAERSDEPDQDGPVNDAD